MFYVYFMYSAVEHCGSALYKSINYIVNYIFIWTAEVQKFYGNGKVVYWHGKIKSEITKSSHTNLVEDKFSC